MVDKEFKLRKSLGIGYLIFTLILVAICSYQCFVTLVDDNYNYMKFTLIFSFALGFSLMSFLILKTLFNIKLVVKYDSLIYYDTFKKNFEFKYNDYNALKINDYNYYMILHNSNIKVIFIDLRSFQNSILLVLLFKEKIKVLENKEFKNKTQKLIGVDLKTVRVGNLLVVLYFIITLLGAYLKTISLLTFYSFAILNVVIIILCLITSVVLKNNGSLVLQNRIDGRFSFLFPISLSFILLVSDCLKIDVVSNNNLLGITLISTILIVLIVVRKLRSHLNVISKSEYWFYCIIYCIMFLYFSYFSTIVINTSFDSGTPVIYSAIIVEKNNGWIKLSGNEVEIPNYAKSISLDDKTFKTFAIDEEVNINIHKGYLGVVWYYVEKK